MVLRNTIKKMKNRLVILVIALCSSSSVLKAQVVKEVLNGYPALVVNQVNLVCSNVSIPSDKQLMLARYFSEQDKLANNVLKSGGMANAVAPYYTIDANYLKSILSPLEFNDYLYNSGKDKLQLSAALKYRRELTLSEAQVKQLLDLVSVLRMQVDTLSLPVPLRRYQARRLQKALNAKQYASFLQLLVIPTATEENEIAWNQIKALNIPQTQADFDDDLRFFMRTDANDARVLNNDPTIRIDSVRSEYFVFKPKPLLKLDMMNRNLPVCQFADVLNLRASLKLTNRQTDSLLTCVGKFEEAKAAFKASQPYKKYDGTPYETKNLSIILERSQYDAFLVIKNKEHAIVNEKKTWGRLKQYGLTQGVDSAKVNNELIEYELNKLVAAERYHIDDSQQNAESKAKAESDKPLILRKLDISVKTTALTNDPKKTLAW